MTDVVRTPTDSSTELDTSVPATPDQRSRTGLSADALRRAIIDHLRYSIGRPAAALRARPLLPGAGAGRARPHAGQPGGVHADVARPGAKVTCYLSAEFLIGPQLGNNLLNLGIEDAARAALDALGQDLDEVLACEEEPGLGNGGLGRLAACFLDSMATLEHPAIGYGIRYEFGIFQQEIRDGWQVEQTDNWLRNGNPWEIAEPDVELPGPLRRPHRALRRRRRRDRVRWVPRTGRQGRGLRHPDPGLRQHLQHPALWSARAVESFDFDAFNGGDYYKAVEDEVTSENLTKVLYPNDEPEAGKRLRLRQQYFFVSCSLQDVAAHHGRPRRRVAARAPAAFAFQLNDTHPAVAVAELMRLLVDEHRLGWDEAWAITAATFGYTNHTLLPEALEKWPLALFGESLPRHLEIIYEINRRFLDEVRAKFPGDDERVRADVADRRGRRQDACAWRTSPPSAATPSTASPRCTRTCSRPACCRTSPRCGRSGSATRPTASRRAACWRCPTRPARSSSTTRSATAG